MRVISLKGGPLDGASHELLVDCQVCEVAIPGQDGAFHIYVTGTSRIGHYDRSEAALESMPNGYIVR